MGKGSTELKKQLKIVFVGEEGVDEGGVKVLLLTYLFVS